MFYVVLVKFKSRRNRINSLLGDISTFGCANTKLSKDFYKDIPMASRSPNTKVSHGDQTESHPTRVAPMTGMAIPGWAPRTSFWCRVQLVSNKGWYCGSLVWPLNMWPYYGMPAWYKVKQHKPNVSEAEHRRAKFSISHLPIAVENSSKGLSAFFINEQTIGRSTSQMCVVPYSHDIYKYIYIVCQNLTHHRV